MRQIYNRLKIVFAAFAFVLTTAVASGGPVFADSLMTPAVNPPGNNGTLKIHEQGTPDHTINNDPKVCVFNVEGFGFDAGQTGYLTFDVQGGDAPTGTAAGPYDFGPTDSTGYYASRYFNLDPGHYKATLYGKMGPNGQLQDEKAKSKVFKVECGTTTTEVTPTTPIATEASCQNPNITITPPAIDGILWSPSGATVLQPGEHVTYTATADTANGYVLKTGVKTSWDFTNDFDTSNCPHTTVVTPIAPSVTTPTCEAQNMVVTLYEQEGVVWSPSSSTILQPGHSVTYTASAATDFSIAAGAQTSWTFKNNFDPSSCGPCGCTGTVSTDTVYFKDFCGLENDFYRIPSTSHVKYYVNGSTTAATAGKHYVTAAGTVNVVAKADTGYKLSGQSEWHFTFTDVPCVNKVKPPRVIFTDLCGTDNDKYVIPNKANVEYLIDGHVVAAGEYDGHGTVTVTAAALNGYMLKGDKTSWTHTFTDEECGGGHGGGGTTPGGVSFTDITCTANGTFTIPNTPGVVYKDAAGNVLTAGTHQVTAGMTLAVTAFAADTSVTLEGTTHWNHTFTVPTNCETGGHGGGPVVTPPAGGQGGGFVLGSSTEVVPSVGRGGEVLANTGSETLLTTLLSLLLLGGSVALYAYRPKVQQN